MKIEEAGTINNTAFAGQEVKTKLRLAGVIKSIDDRATPYGDAKRFKGDIALELGDTVYTARTGFFPGGIRDALINAVIKLGKWTVFEFVLTATKTADGWSVAFDTAPRIQQPRVIALLED